MIKTHSSQINQNLEVDIPGQALLPLLQYLQRPIRQLQAHQSLLYVNQSQQHCQDRASLHC